MLFKRSFIIELDEIPKSSDDVCFAVAKYCAENQLSYEFLKRTEPVIAIIDGVKYEIERKYIRRYVINCWVLRCREID